MINGLKLSKSALMRDAVDFNYKKKIRGTLARIDDTISIQMIISDKPGKGNCQKFIKLLKKDCEEKRLKLESTTSISNAWTHICKKLLIHINE
jgi:hypothetical protein